ncbi:tryptophan halogenase family protein [Embleya hyalina]|uniref:Flavin-dependent tryptophan halogenase RebH n=1 Tax=Embleya hyalina TaxID=516124 RepID=A0A401Z618_9ACTN|nr:tryptophan halogenase family protein [Embleya hyalina]GCE02310.1 flavin-dependent tryptophan halogenase RebH [Embleya hyalina]
MDHRIKRLVVLGGGTAGWMTASYLGKALQGAVDITVLEAPTIPRIGVGEATVPNLQSAFFDYLGIPEDEWMRECNASFKAGIRFVNWRTPGNGAAQPRALHGGVDHFYHHFANLPEHDGIPLSHYWHLRTLRGETDVPFDYACFAEAEVLDAKKGPRYGDGSQATGYAWHFDANLVADFLRRFATEKQGVRHVRDEMTEAVLDERGHITALRTKEGRLLEGDLFVDCSGFRGLLINQAMEEPFLDMSDQLLCDSAVATAIPHDDAANGVEPFTSAIAMSSGWTWKIPMLTRFGTGYVYSSKFTGQDEATREFCDLWGLNPDRTPFNHVRFRVGRNRRAWVRNVVSIGLASCFVEPLESTGIYFIYSAVHQLAKHFPDKRFDPTLVDHFNREVESMFDFTRDFIQTHFYFSPRTDTEFWRANKELPLGDDVREKISLYRAGFPVNTSQAGERVYYGNSEVDNKNFWNNTNYWCIFAGLGHLPDRVLPALEYKPASIESVENLFAEVESRRRHLLAELPTTHEFLRQLHGK